MRVHVKYLLCTLAFAAGPGEAAVGTSGDEAQFRAIYEQLVDIDTTRSSGSCTRAAEAMRERLATAGLARADLRILAPADRPQDGALIATFHGQGRSMKPMLLLAHLDVVEAKREEWQRDPFRLIEEGGTFYARGASDDKAMAAIFVDSLIRYAREGFKPHRDIKLALTCGEETPDVFNSVRWLLDTDPTVLDAEFAINEGSFGELDPSGKPTVLQVQAGEKIYQDFVLEASDVGGHSARPNRNNPIVRLSFALASLGNYEFPIALNSVTRKYFEAEAKLAPPELATDMLAVLHTPDTDPPNDPSKPAPVSVSAAAAARLWASNPSLNAALRTTCVVTQIIGGHAANALPQHVRATVNCRILPGNSVAQIREEIVRVLADSTISVSMTGPPALESPVPDLTETILKPVRRVAATIWPGISIVPTMLVAATDGRFLNAKGVPTYGISGLFFDADGSHAHGLNEHIRVKSLLDGRRFLYELIKIYANPAR